MKKLFISQPMNGRTDEEILRERYAAVAEAEQIIGEPVTVLDSFFENAPSDAGPLWYIGQSILLLAFADAVYFCKGWQNARGCRIEHECAKEYGLDCIE